MICLVHKIRRIKNIKWVNRVAPFGLLPTLNLLWYRRIIHRRGPCVFWRFQKNL
jgi:hypothetical protein